MDGPILSIDRLTQKFGDFTAVDALSMDVGEGEIFGFLGHNGAGKTTTIQMLTTLSRPASGTARVQGHEICTDPMEVRRRIGYVPENVRLYDTMTARENLLFFARLSGVVPPVADLVLATTVMAGLTLRAMARMQMTDGGLDV